MISVKCCRFYFLKIALCHVFPHMEMSSCLFSTVAKDKCSHCVAWLHVFACNLMPLCNALLGQTCASEGRNPGDVKSIDKRIELDVCSNEQHFLILKGS